MSFVSRANLPSFGEHFSLSPDLSRALRATVAFMVPLLLATLGWLPVEVSFAALAAQNIAMLDVRGDYRLRFGLVVAMTFVFTGAAALGGLASGPDRTLVAVLATIFIAACGSLWRHLSSDYGPSLAISSTLVFLIALASPGGPATAAAHSSAAFIGGLWGIFLQVANWPFRPQHPLRRTVSDSWIAVAGLFEAMNPAAPAPADRHQRVAQAEAAVRTALDTTYAALAAARPGRLRERLEALNVAAGRLATRVVALNTAIEMLMAEAGFSAFAPALEPVLVALANTARTVAVAVVSRQPGHLRLLEVRRRRLTNLLRVLRARIAAHPLEKNASTQLADILRQLEEQLPFVHDALRATIERANERAAASLELFDLRDLTLRPLASALNLSGRVDPALIRFTLRIAVLTALGVVIFKSYRLPHGYWLPFTIVVVLQPDYGSTRKRAAQRMLGTFAGSVIASGLLWLKLPFAGLMTATAATIFVFGYFVKRNYGVAVFFVTLWVVLLTEASGTVNIDFTIERLTSTLAGGALALLAAMFFWPAWERERFPPILAAAFRANRDYWLLLTSRLATGGGYDATVIAAKRKVESANTAAFSSLQRMNGDPKSQQDRLEHFATLANGNQRLTRALNVVALHLPAGNPITGSAQDLADAAGHALDVLAEAVVSAVPPLPQLTALRAALEQIDLLPAARATDSAKPEAWVFAPLTRAATELSAMLIALEDAPTAA